MVCAEALILGLASVGVMIHGIWLQTYRKWSNQLLDCAHVIVASALNDFSDPNDHAPVDREEHPYASDLASSFIDQIVQLYRPNIDGQ